jgi:hypothetical protein
MYRISVTDFLGTTVYHPRTLHGAHARIKAVLRMLVAGGFTTVHDVTHSDDDSGAVAIFSNGTETVTLRIKVTVPSARGVR